MVSVGKRMKYVSENDFSSSEGEENYEDSDYTTQRRKKASLNSSPKNINHNNSKWLSKNAIMARENRLKKKLYVTNLENEVEQLKTDNNKFTKLIDNQSLLIKDLRKEIAYLKSVIVNSGDIGNLIRNIQQSTGMSVRTTLDKTLSLNNACVSKPKRPAIARKTAHPWDETRYPSYPTPESETSPHCGDNLNDFSPDLVLFNGDDHDLLGHVDSLLEIPDNFIENTFTNLEPKKEEEEEEEEEEQAGDHLKEHNYTSSHSSDRESEEHDVGVCLHVSKHRVSLEFCSSCSENASQTWMD